MALRRAGRTAAPSFMSWFGATTVVALVGVVLASLSLSPAAAATVAKHEVTAAWVSPPAKAPYGSIVTAEYHINTNDTAIPPTNSPDNNLRITLTATGGTYTSLPKPCKTTGVTPISSFSGNVLVCNFGTIAEGTAVSFQAPMRVTGISGNVSTSGVVNSDSAAAPTAAVATTPIAISFIRSADLGLEYAPNSNYQGGFFTDSTGAKRLRIVMTYSVNLAPGSLPLANANYSFPVKVTTATAGASLAGLRLEGTATSAAVTGTTGAACQPITNGLSNSVGQPYSAAAVADRAPFVQCGVSGSGVSYNVTLSNWDFTFAHVPTKDSTATTPIPLPKTGTYVASGAISFSLPAPLAVTTDYKFTATPPQFTFVDNVKGNDADTTNNFGDAIAYVGGSYNAYWSQSGRSAWDLNYYLTPGSATQGIRSNSIWNGYKGTGGANYAGECMMFSSKNFVAQKVSSLLGNPGFPSVAPTTAKYWYSTKVWTTGATGTMSTELCNEAVPSTTWIAVTNINALPANVTAVKLTWNPAVDKARSVGFYVNGIIAPTAAAGSQIWITGAQRLADGTWTNTSNTSAAVNPTTGLQFPSTTGTRDLLRVVGLTGAITKTASDTTATPGIPVGYTINARAVSNATAASPPTTFTVVDTLPAGMTYVTGSGVPAPLSVAGQVVTWKFTNVAVNVNQKITYQAVSGGTIAGGTSLTNSAVVNVPGDVRAAAAKTAKATVVTRTDGVTHLVKSSDNGTVPYAGGTSGWTLKVISNDTVASPRTDTIDILPVVGDGRGTNIDGTYTVGTPVVPAGAKVYYSTAALSALHDDPRHASNGTVNATTLAITGSTVGWTATKPAKPTAIRVIGPALAAGATQTIRIPFTTPAGLDCTAPAPKDNKPGQALVNSADSIASHTGLPMLSSSITTIANCFALDLKKYVLASGGDPANDDDWLDAQTAADYPQYATGDPVPYKIVVTNQGTGTLTNVAVTDPIVTDCAFTIASLAADASQTKICEGTAAVGTTVNVATAAVTATDGTKLTDSDPAGIVVPEPYHVKKVSDVAPGTPVAPGQVIHYTITVHEPDTSPAPAINPSFSDSLAQVLDDASYNDDVTSVDLDSTDADQTFGDVAVTGNSIDWSADTLQPGQTATITYSVTVDLASTGDKDLKNPVTTPPPGNCIPGNTDPDCLVDLGLRALRVEKGTTADQVTPDSVVPYTITIENTGGVDYPASDPAKITDDLSDVLDDADYNGDVDNGATFDGDHTISWSGALAVGAKVTLSYTVTVHHVLTGAGILTNNVETTPGQNGNCDPADPADPDSVPSNDPACVVQIPGTSFHVVKAADHTTANQGDTVTYTLVVSNTGQTDYDASNPAKFDDNLSGVLDDATYNGDADQGAVYDPATKILHWEGVLNTGDEITITYTVTVKNPDKGDLELDNTVSTPPGLGGNCTSDSTDPDCVANVPVRAFTAVKTSSVVDTTLGGTVTYTVTVTNTGAVDLDTTDPASFVDTLTGVLDDASWVGDQTNGAVFAAASGTDPATLSWSGPLAIGASTTITYSVTVNDPASGDGVLKNVVVTPPGGNCPDAATIPDCKTTTPIKSYTTAKTASVETTTPGQVVKYTITVVNTGKVAYTATKPASYADKFVDVLDDATYNNDATNGAVFDSTTGELTWAGALGLGETKVITYSVTVNDPDTGNFVLNNAVVTPPDTGGDCPTASTNPDCKTTTPVASYHTQKSVNATTTTPGSTLTYTIVVTNTGQVDYTTANPATYEDNLTRVLDDATYNNDADQGAVFNTTTKKLTWAGAVAIGGSVTITYTVTVKNPDDGDNVLDNTITTPPDTGSNCPDGSTDPDCSTSTPVQSYHVEKTASVDSALPGDAITYTIVVTNTGQVDYTTAQPASYTDDLTDVLKDAVYNSDADSDADAKPVYTAPSLDWSGELPIGATVTITYSVTVDNPDTGDELLENTVVTPPGSGANCPTGGTDPDCSVAVPVKMLEVAKNVSATSAFPGDTVTYTITVHNAGQVAFTTAAPAHVSDDLTNMLDDATYNGDANNGAVYAPAVPASGGAPATPATLSWSGPLAIGATQTITYTATVNDPDNGDHLLENPVTTTPGDGGNCDDPTADPDCETSTPVQSFTALKTADRTTVVAGDTVTYTILLTNTGTVDYTTATKQATYADKLTDVLDAATYNNDVTNGAIYDAPTQTINWTGDLPVGGTASFTYSVTINDPITGDKKLHNSVVVPPGLGGDCLDGSKNLDCTADVPGRDLHVEKSVDVLDAAPGQVVTYTIVATNTGQVDFDAAQPAALTDNLSKVLDDAAYNADAKATYLGATSTAGLSYSSPKLDWTGVLKVGESVTIVYTVTVNDPDAGDHLLDNTVTTPTNAGGNCGPTSTDPLCSTSTPVRSFSAVKTSDSVDAAPGDVVTYTVVLTNTGQVDYSSAGTPATFTDLLGGGAGGVLDDAAYNNDAASTSADQPTYAAPHISWSGDLAIGGVVTITYSVTVDNPDTGDHMLDNAIVTGPGGDCPLVNSNPNCDTATPIRSYHVEKSADVVKALPGDVVTYTVTVVNTGQADYAAATFLDDLTNVLDDATYNGDASGGAVYADAQPAGADPTTDPAVPANISWSGELLIGQTLTFTYSVTVDDPDAGDYLLTNVVTTPADGGGDCPATPAAPDCTTTTPVQAYTAWKTSSETSAVEGDTITYTITIENLGQVAYTVADPASYTDNLANVLDDATYNNDATNGATYTAPTIGWSGAVAIGATETFTYTVTVDSPDRGDHVLKNTIVTPGANCPDGSTDPACTTLTPVRSFHVEKTVDQTSFLPGDTITYHIVATNTGALDYTALDPASYTDDLTAVLDDATFGAVTAPGTATFDGAHTLSWSGPLAIGASEEITYTVVVNDPNTGDKKMHNVVVTPPGSGANCPLGGTDPACVADVPGPQLTVVKTASSAVVMAGNTVTYTITFTNTGGADFPTARPASGVDDLSDVLDDAVYNGDARATAGTVDYSAPVLSWSGPLAVGATVTVTYTATVHNGGAGDRILDNTVVTPPGMNSNCPDGSTKVECSTRTLVQSLSTVKTTTSTGPLKPGDTIVYSILVTNTGQVDYAAPKEATFSDDFTGVLDDATFNNDVVSSAGAITYQEPKLVWSGPLAIGASATVTYSFTINDAGGDGMMKNAVVSPVTIGGDCFSDTLDPDCQLQTLVERPLAFTGANVLPTVIGMVILLGLGAVLFVIGRRRRQPVRRRGEAS